MIKLNEDCGASTMKPLLLNPQHIVSVRKTKSDQAVLTTVVGHTILVVETFSDVEAMLRMVKPKYS